MLVAGSVLCRVVADSLSVTGPELIDVVAGTPADERWASLPERIRATLRLDGHEPSIPDLR